MAVSPLPVFTPTGYTQIAAMAFSSSIALPLTGGETSALVTEKHGAGRLVVEGDIYLGKAAGGSRVHCRDDLRNPRLD